MEVICFENKGGYELYGVDITLYMRDFFDNVKVAYDCFFTDDMSKAKEIAQIHYNMNSCWGNGTYAYDEGTIRIEFENGKIIELANSELAAIRILDSMSEGVLYGEKLWRIKADNIFEESLTRKLPGERWNLQ